MKILAISFIGTGIFLVLLSAAGIFTDKVTPMAMIYMALAGLGFFVLALVIRALTERRNEQ